MTLMVMLLDVGLVDDINLLPLAETVIQILIVQVTLIHDRLMNYIVHSPLYDT